jgi:hypothetical protein
VCEIFTAGNTAEKNTKKSKASVNSEAMKSINEQINLVKIHWSNERDTRFM